MARELQDWISAYLQFTENSESPRSFHLWCGLSLVAGALQRKVYLKQGFETIYPNLYVVLVGPSGSRKGLALGIAKDLLVNVPGVSVAPESSSGREAMIQAMKRAYGNYEDPTDHKIKFHCSLTAFSEELAVFLGQKDIKYLANLTDWYDSKDVWRYETIGRGIDDLQGLCFNLLGATAPDWMQSMLPQEAMGGGLTARVIFVCEEHKGKSVPDHTLTPYELSLKESLIRDLERISQLAGQMEFLPDGLAAYKKWYSGEDAEAMKGEYAIPDKRFHSYCDRRATHIRKLMIVCSAACGDDMQLNQTDFAQALSYLKLAERKMHKAFGGMGQSRTSEPTEKVKDYIQAVGVTTRSALMAKFYRDIDAPTLKVIEENLTQMKVIKVELLVDKGDKVYRWIT